MDKRLIPLVMAMSLATAIWGQSIRKNYTEMTAEEKTALVNAFHAKGDASNSLVRELANFHNNNFYASSGGIHIAPIEANNVFHAWHRQAAFELEQELQLENPHISIPYWDWTVNNSTTDVLWESGFMGGFNSSWSLGRCLGCSPGLPSSGSISTLQGLTSFWVGTGNGSGGYSYNTESSCIHNCAHNWVGGVMASGGSPLDPVFWFHHNMVDKLWQEWEDQEPAMKSFFTKTSLPRYPAVDPDNIRDSRSLGVFYANNQLAILDNYIVANTTKSPEQFTYQYTIRASDFTVPAGKSCVFRSKTGVELEPGFVVDGGSFTAEILASGSLLAKTSATENTGTGDGFISASLENPLQIAKGHKYFLSPRGDRLILQVDNEIHPASIKNAILIDAAGKVIEIRSDNIQAGTANRRLNFNLNGIRKGIYFIQVQVGVHVYTGRFARMTDL